MVPDNQPDIPPEALEKLEKLAEDAGVIIVVVGSGSAFSTGRVQRRLSVSLGLAAALALAAAPAAAVMPTGPLSSSLRLFPRGKSAVPGMDKRDLQRLQRQHAQKANAKSRYKPR